MAQLSDLLPDVAAAYIIHPMVDLTGLKDAYDFDLTWTPRKQLSGTPDRGAGAGQTAAEVGQAAAPASDLTVFDAIDKQLGLKLEERKHPMPVIVIDHVDRTPAEN
jgi:uncharacterized protein (TIGR03435 family)